MKIAAIRTIALSCTVDPPYASAAGVQSRRGGLIVEVETDDGIIGIGEAGLGGGATATVIEKDLAPMLVGQDPLLIEGLWQMMFARTRQYGRRGVVMQAISGIDIALWDIAGKVARMPVYKLLGACRDRVEAYASGGFYQEGKSASDLAGEAESYRARGAAALATPIAGYETELGLYGFRELISRGAVDIVQPDLAWSGGFSECRRIAAYAGAHHRMVAPHAFASAVNLVAALHFAAAIPNALVLEWDQNPNAIRDELLKEPLRLEKDGTVKLPERPGLGIELDRAAVERYRVA